MILKALNPDHYADPATGDIGTIVKADLPIHLNHCVDMVRQALMCAADITYVEVNPLLQFLVPNPDLYVSAHSSGNGTKMCRRLERPQMSSTSVATTIISSNGRRPTA